MQILYEMDLSGLEAGQALRAFYEHLSPSDEPTEFTSELVRGFAEQRERVDETIRQVSRHWRLERMARVDRNIIRLATYELLCREDIPARVTLNEAVELAKRFGDEQSPAFVNGVLDKIAEVCGGT